jgi:hypothetical protein
MTHFHAIAGMHGYLPNLNEVHESIDEACDSITSVHELGRRRDKKLREDLYIELNLRRDGNEYAEVTACDEEDCEAAIAF